MRYKKLLLVFFAMLFMFSFSACSISDITTLFDKKDTTYNYVLPESLIAYFGYEPEEFVTVINKSKAKAKAVSYNEKDNSITLTLNKSQRRAWLNRTENDLEHILNEMQKADESFDLSFSSDFSELDMSYIDKSRLHSFKVTNEEYEAVQNIENKLTKEAIANCGLRQILKNAENWSVEVSVINSETRVLVAKSLVPKNDLSEITDEMWQESIDIQSGDK